MPGKIVARALLLLVVGCGRDEVRTNIRAEEPAGSQAVDPEPSDRRPVILFLGTSLTAGLGLEPEQAYPALIQHKLDSAGVALRAVNAGVNGETSAGGLRRLDWLLQLPVEVLVLELGANDGLRGLQIEAMRANLQKAIDRTRQTYPGVKVVLAGMQAPPNLGDRYTTAFRQVFADLAAENHAALVPFLLDGVAGNPALNQADRIHPTAEGEKIVADNVWKVLRDVVVAPPSQKKSAPR